MQNTLALVKSITTFNPVRDLTNPESPCGHIKLGPNTMAMLLGDILLIS